MYTTSLINFNIFKNTIQKLCTTLCRTSLLPCKTCYNYRIDNAPVSINPFNRNSDQNLNSPY